MAKRFRTIEISNPAFQPPNLTFVTVKSSNLKGRGDCSFFIPPQLTGAQQTIPVVILLHGVYGSHWAWTYNINVHGIAMPLIDEGAIPPMVLVMPSDGLFGDGSGYFNHGDQDFEKWIVKDVVNIIKEVLKVDQENINLFIAGLSMGGYGALRLMAKYPKLFVAASGLSSITNLKDLLPFLSREEQRYYSKKFKSEELINYLKKNRKKLPPFRFDCGADDSLIKSNRLLHSQLEREGIPHVYEEFQGGHSNDYWNLNIGKTLVYFSTFLDKV
ncbi:MAG TPA: alpha/beta hydrolase-fold protein [Chryseolinea sp.]|nr:alpha/beta hydrolase-fold protein [Chryseolinea sp.]